MTGVQLVWLLPLACALVDWYAVWRGERRTEQWAKPATLVALIVAALSSGCDTMDHVVTQLPFALLVAASAEVSYAGIALGLPAWLATLAAAGFMLLALAVLALSGWRQPQPAPASSAR